MPRVTGPLFSVTARGTLGGLLTYRQRQTTALVSRASAPTGPASAAQSAYRGRIAEMAASWLAQSQPTRDAWRAAAAALGMSGYQYWWREWIAQGSTPADPPNLP